MNYTNFLLIIGLGIIIASFSMTVYDFNNKFDNINENFQKMVESNFNLQLNNMIYNCMQDYKIELASKVSIVDAMNERTNCLLRVDVAEKIYNYQTKGISPVFTDDELEIVEQIASQNKFPMIEELRVTTTNSTD